MKRSGTDRGFRTTPNFCITQQSLKWPLLNQCQLFDKLFPAAILAVFIFTISL